PSLSQCSVSFNHRRGTLRGLHYQIPPHAEVKLVRCIRGALFDVAVDLRPDSTTFGRHHGAELSAANGRALYIPRGFAHGFYTLADATEVEYFIGTPYQPEAARGHRLPGRRVSSGAAGALRAAPRPPGAPCLLAPPRSSGPCSTR